MCSVQEEGAVAPEPRSTESVLSRPCMKCGAEACILIRNAGDPFCRECFLSYCGHKFRSVIGKSKSLFADGERVVVAFSGDSGSHAMLHLIQEGHSGRNKKKLRFNTDFCFIDDGAVLGKSVEERLKHCEQVKTVLQGSGYSSHMIALEQVLRDRSVTKEALSYYCSDNLHADIAQQDSDSLKSMLASFKSNTAKENILHTLKQQLLINVAREHGYKKVLLGETATQLSAKLLANIAQGRGAQLPQDVGFVDKRHDDVWFIRPLREFTAKEVAMYNVYNGLRPIVAENLTTKAETSASIGRLTENFVNGLQADFPSTVTTVMRTGEKFDSSRLKESSSAQCDTVNTCAMCQAALDTNVPLSSALNSTIHSESLTHSSTKDSSCANAEETTSSCTSNDDHESLSKAQVIKSLCYACRLNVREVEDLKMLPYYVQQDAAWRVKRDEMRKSVQEFLIEDGS